MPSLGYLWRISGYTSTIEKFLFGVAVVLSAATGVIIPLANVVFGRLVTSFNEYFMPGSTISKDHFTSVVNKITIYILCLCCIKLICTYFSTYVLHRTAIRIACSIRHAYMAALLKQPVRNIDQVSPGKAAETLITASNNLQCALSESLGVAVQSIALIVSAYAVALTHSWALTLASSSVLLLLVAICLILGPAVFRTDLLIAKADRDACGIASEAFRSIRTLKALCAETDFATKFEQRTNRARKSRLRRSRLAAATLSLPFFGTYASIALALWLSVKFYSEGKVSNAGTVITVLFSMLLVEPALGKLVNGVHAISNAISSLVPCLDMIKSPCVPEGGLRGPEFVADSDICFEDVRFTYPRRPQSEILKGLTLRIPAGKRTALIGPSGCGKSTIVALLERWYDISEINEAREEDESGAKALAQPLQGSSGKLEDGHHQSNTVIADSETLISLRTTRKTVHQNSGAIFVGPHNIESLDRKWWRAQIGLVQQEPFLFNETVYENVAHGLTGSPWEHSSFNIKQRLVEEACKDAFADEFIRHLPAGYQTDVGEGGNKLSGGQRQRLAIARSIVKRPAIVIFDEATSSLDASSERLVLAAFDRVSASRTSITIAHRLSSIKSADHIIMLDDGMVIEQGSQDELIRAEKSLYSSLISSQGLQSLDIVVEGCESPGTELKLRSDPASATPANKINLEESCLIKPRCGECDSIRPRPGLDSAGLRFAVDSLFVAVRFHRFIISLTLLGTLLAGAAIAGKALIVAHLIVTFQNTDGSVLDIGSFWALMALVLAIAVALGYSWVGYGSRFTSVHICITSRQRYLESMLSRPVSWFDQEDSTSSALSAQLVNHPQQLQQIFGLNMALAVVGMFQTGGCMAISFVYGWKLTLVTLFTSLPVIVTAIVLRVRHEVMSEVRHAAIFADSAQFASESIGAFRTVVALTIEDVVVERYRELLKKRTRQGYAIVWSTLVYSLSNTLDMCCTALAFWYGGRLLADREYNVLQFFIIYIAIVIGAQATGLCLAFGPNLAQALSASRCIARVCHDRDSTDRVSSEESGSMWEVSNEGVEIEFRKVAFTYPTRTAPVYRNLSFTIARGEYVAVIGASGCGKTTIISLLQRFYRIRSGRILIDGEDIDKIPLGLYRSRCAVVEQSPTIFKGTVRENLTLGLRRDVSESDLVQCCKAAEIYDFILSLPQGFDTELSSGTSASLSGGQKQRLCIARAILRKPRLLLLDEPTSSLDGDNEALVLKSIHQIAYGGQVTVLVIAHRLATVRSASRIIVIGDNGDLMEHGTHEELTRSQGLYREMCIAQRFHRQNI